MANRVCGVSAVTRARAGRRPRSGGSRAWRAPAPRSRRRSRGAAGLRGGLRLSAVRRVFQPVGKRRRVVVTEHGVEVGFLNHVLRADPRGPKPPGPDPAADGLRVPAGMTRRLQDRQHRRATTSVTAADQAVRGRRDNVVAEPLARDGAATGETIHKAAPCEVSIVIRRPFRAG